MPQNSATLTFIASPRGRRSGLVTLDDGNDGALVIAILPKLWAENLREHYCFSHSPGHQTHISVFETQRFSIRTSATALGYLVENLSKLSSQYELLTLAPPRGAEHTQVIDQDSNSESYLQDLFQLLQLANRTKSSIENLEILGGFEHVVTRFVKQQELIELAIPVILRSSPNFRSTSDTLPSPKGRLNSKDVAYAELSGWPRIQSTFDELSYDTPQLQVLKASLHVIANDNYPGWVRKLVPSLQSSAVQLSQHLRGVTLLRPADAVSAASSLRFTPSERVWEKVMVAAIAVLRRSAVTPDTGVEKQRNVFFTISTEKFWEECLEIGIRRISTLFAVNADGEVDPRVEVFSPWSPEPRESFLELPANPSPTEVVNERFPDFLFSLGEHLVVADAKYKLIHSRPSSSDANQMFAYSHLSAMAGKIPNSAALIYPTSTAEIPRQLETFRMPGRDMKLWLIHVHFPARTDLHNTASWFRYLDRLTGQLSEMSRCWFGTDT